MKYLPRYTIEDLDSVVRSLRNRHCKRAADFFRV